MPKKKLQWTQKLPSATVICPNCKHSLWVFVQWHVSDTKAYKVLEADLRSKRRTRPESEADTQTDTETDTT